MSFFLLILSDGAYLCVNAEKTTGAPAYFSLTVNKYVNICYIWHSRCC